jgi:hypothetical protein
MGLFPYDDVSSLERRGPSALLEVAQSDSEAAMDRDQAMWNLVYRAHSGGERRAADLSELRELCLTLATSDRSPSIRRSATWALLKLGDKESLHKTPVKDDDGNTESWKQSLIYESEGRTDYVDPRPVRLVESEFGFGVTLPLTIHGVVQFRSFAYQGEDQYSQGSDAGEEAQYRPSAEYGYGHTEASKGLWSSAGSGYESERYKWNSLVAGPQTQRALVGDLTAAVTAETFYDNLVIQKVCTDTRFTDSGHVQGYLFRGMSRPVGANAMAHYYHSETPQPFYLSGRIGDESEGVVQVHSDLTRNAETHIVTNESIPFPYVQSVRGLFFGTARMNTVVVDNPSVPLDRLLQIVEGEHANGWFFGEFRSVPVDVDGDGRIELNGMPMFVDTAANVVERTPQATRAADFVR